MKKKTFVGMLLSMVMLLCCLLSACGTTPDNEGKTRTVVDMAGRTVVLPEKINSYIDLWYSHQAVLAMLDGCEHMAATLFDPDDEIHCWFFEMYPEANFTTGLAEDMPAETFLSLGAELLFYGSPNSDELVTNLEKAGIPCVNVNFDSFETMKKSITLVAEVLNTDEAREKAKKYNAYLDAAISDVSEATKTLTEEEKVSLLALSSFDNMQADGANSLRNNWVDVCGAKSLAAQVGSGKVYINVEQVFEWDPDFVISRSRGDAEWAYGVEDFASLKCIKNRHVYSNPYGIVAWDGSSPEVAIQLRWASQIFYPELFPDTNIKEVIKDFYKEFFNYTLTDKNVENMLNLGLPE